ncbi:MAG: hypothetical protein F6K39_18805 [Okeania sp. SIO3B3]|nr:hypothetical protein [Okeania sp. SIO3B3]
MKNTTGLSSVNRESNRLSFLSQTTEISIQAENFCSDFYQKLLRIINTYIFDSLLKGSEPKIIQKTNKKGSFFWQVYDPVTGERKNLISDQEVREWLDNRYYYL